MKKYLLIVVYALLFGTNASSLNIPCGYLIGNKIHVYKNYNSEQVIDTIDNTNEDNFYIVEVLKIKKSRFFVKINFINYNDTLKIPDYGWVSIGNVGVGLFNQPRNVIPIYKKPDVLITPDNVNVAVESVIATVISVKDDWLKIMFIADNRKIIGWLKYENQCCDLYTMCCGS